VAVVLAAPACPLLIAHLGAGPTISSLLAKPLLSLALLQLLVHSGDALLDLPSLSYSVSPSLECDEHQDLHRPLLGPCPANAAHARPLRCVATPLHVVLRSGGVGYLSRIHAAVAAAYAAAPLSSSPLGASLEAPRAPGGLVGTIAQAHNIELVLIRTTIGWWSTRGSCSYHEWSSASDEM
jgi:hypothetical protein